MKSINYIKSLKIKTFGNSMYPFLYDGDIVDFKRNKFSRVKVNDIITVRKNRELFTHRVIYISHNSRSHYLITKGDTNFTTDGKIHPKQILGKLYQIKRNGKIINPEMF